MTDPIPDPDPVPDPEFPTEGPDDDTRPPVVLVPSPTRQPMPPMPPPPPETLVTDLAGTAVEDELGLPASEDE